MDDITRTAPAPWPEPVTIDKADPRYPDLAGRGINARFPAAPAAIGLPATPRHVAELVEDAVGAGRRLAVRSGGHCFESLVDHPEVDVVIDLSEMKAVGYDPEHRALAVEPGASLGAMYRTLFLGWGVAVPAGRCPEIGVGGHVPGGGGGALSRRYGLSVDHLYGVQVVVADGSGRARAVTATREPGDPNRDLWWAHTGGGAGAFGVVTRYLFRSPDGAAGDGRLLPPAPAAVTKKTVRWSWDDLDESRFVALVRAFGLWHERNSAPGDSGAQLDNSLTLPRAGGGEVTLETAFDAGRPDAADLADALIADVGRAAGSSPEVTAETRSFLAAVLVPDEFAGVKGRFKSKAAFLRSCWQEDVVARLYRRLTDRSGYQNPAAAFYLLSHGGAINAVGQEETAMAHRDAVLKAYGSVFWWDPREDEVHLGWIRDTYHELFADAGGVPDPDRGYGGAFVNYADADFADPELNRSGVPWHRLYFRGNYARLQEVKGRWDPGEVFRHALSVRPPGA
ncbi:FAD-dependent oxidoreductase [Nonomuraea montanisoli]|uniref:FAD-dependent oxidoreductase n=1 Tax=Nonomuraea montanisoli TaxID=2741721 RepID=UPI0019659762|nr:FAD-binding protein [Nonomuraea montanisoli]